MFCSIKRSLPETRHNPYVGYLFLQHVKVKKDASTQTDTGHLRGESSKEPSTTRVSSWFVKS